MNKNLMDKLTKVHFGSQLDLYMSKKLVSDNYDIYLSDLIEDIYWNFATNIKSESKEEFLVDWKNIKETFKTYNRQPIIYFTPLSPLYSVRSTIGLDILYTDLWLILEDLKGFPHYKSKIELTIDNVDKSNVEEFSNAVSDGFSSDDPNDPYQGLTEGYKIALKNSISKDNSNYKIKHYLAKYNEKAVGTATVNYDNEIACVYNVTTNKDYQHNGICKEIMSNLIKDMLSNNI